MKAKEQRKILVTGGSGLLGEEIKKLLPKAKYPGSSIFDITDFSIVDHFYLVGYFETCIHCAAFASPSGVEKDPMKGLEVNIIGTCNIVRLCKKLNIKLIYISTDYVFKGDTGGGYKEDEDLNPVNKYAWSKLGGEAAVRLYDNSLIIRLSFGPNEFPYDKAFSNQYTSRVTVKEAAEQIVEVVEKDIFGVIHLGHASRTVYSYAKDTSLFKKIEPASRLDVDFKVPRDTSLNIEKYNNL